MIDWAEMGRKTMDMPCVIWQDIVNLYGLHRDLKEEEE